MTANQHEYDKIQQDIKESSLKDYEDWVSAWTDRMQEANGRGDVRGIFHAVQALTHTREKPPTKITKDANGNMPMGATDVAEVWEKFLSKKFSATEVER